MYIIIGDHPVELHTSWFPALLLIEASNRTKVLFGLDDEAKQVGYTEVKPVHVFAKGERGQEPRRLFRICLPWARVPVRIKDERGTLVGRVQIRNPLRSHNYEWALQESLSFDVQKNVWQMHIEGIDVDLPGYVGDVGAKRLRKALAPTQLRTLLDKTLFADEQA